MSRRPFVYILASERSSAHYKITKLVYAEEFETAPDAIVREKQLKKWRREKKIALIDKTNPEWRDISGDVLLG